MKTIVHHSTLFYYDGPHVFEARDAIGGHYIAVMVGSEPPGAAGNAMRGQEERCLVAGVAPDRLRLFRSGAIDLRSLLLESVPDEHYLAAVDSAIDQPLRLERLRTPLADSDFLPDPGFLLYDRSAEDHVLKEARERNNFVLELVTEPPEAASRHRIRVNTLAGILNHVQALVTYARQAATGTGRRRRDDDMLDVVVPAAAGSFQVILEASNLPDLFGENDLGRALPRVDLLFENTENAGATLAVAKENRGHLAGAYLKLLRFLAQSGTGLRYSWAEPAFDRPVTRSVSQVDAGRLAEVLSTVDKLASEEVTVEGAFERFNRGSGAWGLLTDEGRQTGKIASGGPSLDGLQVGGRYRFHCEEEIEEIDITGRESRTLYLNRHEPA